MSHRIDRSPDVPLIPAAHGKQRGGKAARRLAAGIVSGAIFAALFSFAQPVRAETSTVPGQSNDAYSALVNFGQVPATATPASATDNGYAVLQDFVATKSDAGPTFVVAADTKVSAKKKISVAAEGATYVGSQVCISCHQNQGHTFGETLMGKIFLKNPKDAMQKAGCEACHGPGSLHVKAGGAMDGGQPGDIIAFRPDSPRPVEERNAVCLGCHEKGERTYWSGSTHEERGLACTSCHQIMQKVSDHQLMKGTELETCFQCHKDKRTQEQLPSHMPLIEGKMTCSSCHNPHGSAGDHLLREPSVNETCYKCHADKRGPFLWEHEPVRDDCTNCHEPHGSVNEYLLKIQRPMLCRQCHAGIGHGTPGNPQVVQSVNRSCQNCHTKIHGSNSPAGELFQR